MNFRDAPSVVNAEEAGDLLRVRVGRVRELTNLGLLRRLRYTTKMLYDVREVRRFLKWSTEISTDAYAAAVADARASLIESAGSVV
jgi:hypothetical protein